MEEILHHLGCKNHVNNGIFTISTGAGFLPSTVVKTIAGFFCESDIYLMSLQRCFAKKTTIKTPGPKFFV